MEPTPINGPLWRTLAGRLAREDILVAFVAFAVFARTLNYQLVWDDLNLIPLIAARFRDSGLGGLLTSEFQLNAAEHMGYYRPVVFLSLWLDSRLFPLISYSYHLTNVLLHAANSVLVLLLLRRFAKPGQYALAGALLFAVHPVHTEAVAFVSARTDLWAAFFVFISTLMWTIERERPRQTLSPAYWGALVSLLLGLLSKEVAFMLPVVLLVLDRFQSDGENSWWHRNRRWLLGWLGVFGIVAYLRWGVAGVPFGVGSANTGSVALSLIDRLSLAGRAVVMYSRLLLFPWPLNAYYSTERLQPTFLSVAAAIVLIVAAGASSVSDSRRRGLQSLTWIFLFLLPVLGFVPISSAPVADRFLYTASFGLSLLVTVALGRYAPMVRRRWIIWASCGAVLGALGFASVLRSAVWSNPDTLYPDLAQNPHFVARQYNNLALKMKALGRPKLAFDFYREALSLEPESPEILSNLGMLLLSVGRDEEAIECFRRAIAGRGDFAEALYELGFILAKHGRPAEAVGYFQRALKVRPKWPEALINLGETLHLIGRNEEALTAYHKALSVGGSQPDIYIRIGVTYLSLGRPAEAADALRRAVDLKPDNADARYYLGLALLMTGQVREALSESRALEAMDKEKAADLQRRMREQAGRR